MKTLNQWLSEYGESHQNPTNKLIHWFCVPVIFWTVIALLYSIPTGETEGLAAIVVAVLVIIYYAMLSIALSLSMMVYISFCLYTSHLIVQHLDIPLAYIALILFVLAWIVQFWGHKIEGKKPSFIKDMQFLMIGPAWVIVAIYKKLGLSI